MFFLCNSERIPYLLGSLRGLSWLLNIQGQQQGLVKLQRTLFLRVLDSLKMGDPTGQGFSLELVHISIVATFAHLLLILDHVAFFH